jgi:glucose-1-phosphate adenylyltransferase
VYAAGELNNSLASNGCIIHGTVINSVLSPGVRVERSAVVRDSVIMTDTTVGPARSRPWCVGQRGRNRGRCAGGDEALTIRPINWNRGNLNTGITIIGKRARVPKQRRCWSQLPHRFQRQR